MQCQTQLFSACCEIKGLTISSKPPPGADKRDTSPTIGRAPWIFFATRLIFPKKSLYM
jgi:hypothetical protein